MTSQWRRERQVLSHQKTMLLQGIRRRKTAHAEPPEDNVTVEQPNEEEKAIHKLSEDRVALVQRYDCKLWLSYLYVVKICMIDHFIYDKAG